MSLRNLSRGLSRALTRGMSGASPPDFRGVYASSVSGNNSYTGLSPSQAKLTLAAALALSQAAFQVNLGSGSTFNEALSTSAGVRTVNYGSGAAPIVRGDDAVATWTASGTADVWQKSVANDLVGNNRMVVYRNGIRLTRVADITTCSATPLSFVNQIGSDGSPWTVRINAGAGANPNSDGATYTVNARKLGYASTGDNCSVIGIEASRVGNSNGPFDTSNTLGTTVRQCVAVEGTKHLMTIGGNSTVKQCFLYRNDPPTSYEPTNGMLEFYMITPTGKTCYAEEVIFVGESSQTGLQIYTVGAHGNAGATFASGQLVQCAAVDVQNCADLGTDSDSQDGCFWKRCETFPRLGTITRMMVTMPQTGGTGGLNGVTYTNCTWQIASRGNFTEVFRPQGNYTFLNCCITGPQDGITTYWSSNASGTATANINYNVFYGGLLHICQGASHTLNSDHNIFLAYNPGNSSQVFYSRDASGTDRTTLAAWQSATGKDANSVTCAWADQTSGNQYALFLGISSGTNNGPADGDFRINPNARVYDSAGNARIGTFPDGVSITLAGQQSYRSWNARAAVAGAAPAWPTIPETLTNGRTYVLSPGSWAFGM